MQKCCKSVVFLKFTVFIECRESFGQVYDKQHIYSFLKFKRTSKIITNQFKLFQNFQKFGLPEALHIFLYAFISILISNFLKIIVNIKIKRMIYKMKQKEM